MLASRYSSGGCPYHTTPASISLDGQRQDVAGPAAIVIAPGVVHAFRFAADSEGCVLTFSADRLIEGEADHRDLVLLDEPCAGVNPSLVGDISTLLKELNRQSAAGGTARSFVVIEHNMDFVMDLCHRIMVMVEGKVMAIGTPAEIRANKQVLDAYLGS